MSVKAYVIGAIVSVSVITGAFFYGQSERRKVEDIRHELVGTQTYLVSCKNLLDKSYQDRDGLLEANDRMNDIITDLQAKPPEVVYTNTCTSPPEPKLPDAPIPYLELRGTY